MAVRLIADGGSTKADWVAQDLSGKTLFAFESKGYNPYYVNEKQIAGDLAAIAELKSIRNDVQEVYFYGSGCSSKGNIDIVSHGISHVLPQASVIVDHDLLGAAYATWGGEPAITCILGTGSNSCFFDGKEISEPIPNLGMVLSDEASGGYYGKYLVRDFFYQRMPAALRTAFHDRYQLKRDEVLERIYQQERPSAFLASFMPFLAENREEDYVHQLLIQGMHEFFDYHVSCYENYRNHPVHFIGSVAHYFLPELKEAAGTFQVNIGKVIRRPIDGLIDYHRNYSHTK